MDVIRDPDLLSPPARPAVVTVGNFDGMHRGHRALVGKVRERAHDIDGTSVAVTFDPHPQALLHPERAPEPITTMEERIDILDELGLDRLVIIPFTTALARIEAEDFVTDYLLTRIGTSEIYVGSNFGFGRGKRGNIDLLRRMAAELDFHASVVDMVTDDGTTISSTRIRNLLREGDLQTANEELSRPYQLSGRVVTGEGRGRGIGFPTANVDATKPCLLPYGVYAVFAATPDAEHAGALNYGRRPTFDGDRASIEVHLIDYRGDDLVDRPIRVSFHHRIRAEQRFASVDELRAQIQRDVDRARRLLTAVRR